jgi:hypothetical protein
MRIEGYAPTPTPPGPAQRKPALPPKAAPETASTADAAELTPQERLRQLLEQKRWMAETAFSESGPEPELGKHIDLRV